MGAPLDEPTKIRIRDYITTHHLLDTSSLVIKEAIKQDLSLVISIPTLLKLRTQAKERLESAVAGSAAEVQKEVIEQIKYINPSRYVDMMDSAINDLHARLNDPFYKGDLPAATSLSERLRYLETMIALIHKMMTIIGPPQIKPQGDGKSPMEKKYGADLFKHIEELEGVYRGEFMESIMPENVRQELVNEGVEV
jgi:hypothetical protein